MQCSPPPPQESKSESCVQGDRALSSLVPVPRPCCALGGPCSPVTGPDEQALH